MSNLVYYYTRLDGIERVVNGESEIFIVPSEKFYQFAEYMTNRMGMEWSDHFIEDDELEQDYEDSLVFVKRPVEVLPNLSEYLSSFTGYNYAR